MERNGKQVSIGVDESVLNKSPHKKLVCVACHIGFNPENVPHKEHITPVNCLTCHKDAPLKHQFHPQLAQAISSRQEPDVGCKDCHGTHDIVSPKVPGSKFHASNVLNSCGECHGDIKGAFAASSHGRALADQVQGAPNCLTCHQKSIARTSAKQDSTQLKIAQEEVCLSCHRDDPAVRARTSPKAGFIGAYQSSVHGAALVSGNGKAANCINCHGSHEMKKGSEPSSRVHKLNIPATCAQCHGNIAHEFAQSVHGIAVSNGNLDAPVCTDCHGEHNILKHTDPRSPVARANLSAQVCSPCHNSVRLTSKYGISSDRFQTFSSSYHGLATRAGSVEVANCASCHSSHNIRPSSDPNSTVNKANLTKTCGKCHPGANERFAMGSVHITMTAKEDPLLYWIATTYIALIVVVVGGMFVHNLFDFIKKSKRKLKIRQGLLVEEYIPHRLYLRMSLSERLQHVTLLVSFTALVITGFALKFPDAWWVAPFRNLSPWMFDLRGILHRIAAVVLVGASVYHLYYVFFDQRGKQLIRDLLPNLQDVRDAINVFKYNFGLSPVKPEFGRFSYIEKSEYWSLVWGTVVMGMTGTILWFDNTFLGLLTKLWWDAARLVHYYEAWLATMAIIVWHFYFVIFNPDVYPINLAFWKGTLSEEEMSEEHALELDEIKRRETIEEEEREKLEELKPEEVVRDSQ